MLRLFIALPLSESVRASLSGLYDTDLPDARWTRPAQLHLTLRFLGDTDEAEVPRLTKALSDIPFAPLTLATQGLTAFPTRRNPRVIAAKIGLTTPLQDVQIHIEQTVQTLGFEPEPRPLRPHITLARLRRADPHRVHAFLRQHQDFALSFTAEQFGLYASLLKPDGAVHERLAIFPSVS